MSVTAPTGFVASGTACGIKPSGALDLALVATDDANSVPAAGVFTANLAAAAPVVVSRLHLASSGGRAAAVVVSSGNANAATGERGIGDAERICALAADGLAVAPSDILLCQTGLIGIPLPMAPFEEGVHRLVSSRGAGRDAGELAATAMMTTDTVRKEIVVEGRGFVVGGMAKGAAMLSPRMTLPDPFPHATMLAVITTDALCSPEQLAAFLATAVDSTFNRITVDGCTSTNDTVFVLANGRSGTAPELGELTASLESACGALAQMMVADAEGGTKVAKVTVRGAASDSDAHLAARKVAESSLVKCSLNGEDPYWGRVVSELGSAGVAFALDHVEIAYGGTVVCSGGVEVAHDSDAVLADMKQRSIEIGVRPRHGERDGFGADLRSRVRLHRREQDHFVNDGQAAGAMEIGAAALSAEGSGTALGSGSANAADQKAAILVEALPYIRRFWGKVVVVKYGGNALWGSENDALASFAEDVVLMRSVGMLPVVVHGGGPQIGDLMARLGKVPEFRDGLRVTDAETLEIARMVLVGKVNREIVSAMNVHGPLAVGLSGEDANLLTASPRQGDLGFVGDVKVVDPSIVERLLAQGLVPVVATVAADTKGQAYNINADSVAGALAVALGAEKLVFLTDTEGLRTDPQDPGSLLRSTRLRRC